MSNHSATVFAIAFASGFTLWLVVEFVRLLWDAATDWRREREWRAAIQRLQTWRSGIASATTSPLSPARRTPRLGERYWLAHDASDPAKGGMPVDVVLLDRVGGVYREVPLSRLSRMPE